MCNYAPLLPELRKQYSIPFQLRKGPLGHYKGEKYFFLYSSCSQNQKNPHFTTRGGVNPGVENYTLFQENF